MNVPAGFARDLELVYVGEKTIDALIKDHEKYIRGLARHALRYKTQWMASIDEDDLFQEACYWLVDSLWRWDEDRGTTLERYVVYNIGTRIQMFILAEKAKKRHPDKTTTRIDVWVSAKETRENLESRMSDLATFSAFESNKHIVHIHEIVRAARKTLSVEASKLIAAILQSNEGSFSDAVDRLLADEEFVKLHGKNKDHVSYILKKAVPEVRGFLTDRYNLS